MIDLSSLVKSNCHVHANGMATNSIVLELAEKYGIRLPDPKLDRIREDGSRIWAGDHHSVLHHAYDQTVSLIKEPDDLYKVVKSGLLRDAYQNCIYTHILSSGSNNCRPPIKPIRVFAANMGAIIQAIEHARAETGIEAFVSVSIKRHLKDGAEAAHELLDACKDFQNRFPDQAWRITGIDMAGNEERANCADFKEVFERATLARDKGGLGLKGNKCHSGENLPSHDIHSALQLAGVTEIGHGLSAIHDDKLMHILREREILVHQLLLSNSMLPPERLAELGGPPLQRFHENGLYLGLGTDDPGLQNTTIADEYEAAAALGMTPADLLGFTANSIRLGTMPRSIKEELLGKVAVNARELGIALPPDALRVAAMAEPFAEATLRL